MNRTGRPHEVTPTPLRVDCLAECKSIAGESPIWSVAESCLYFVDHQGRKVHRYRPGKNLETFVLPGVVTAITPRRHGGLIICLHQTFAFFNPDSGKLEMLTNPEPQLPGNR
ncbi:MAG TPA: SMP-30/gluconolactonase/LRE family protein, partial [Dongiaceae bacterium]|nr:SMP-30/gluconolactonase/LRE family protein [Dongiaceae bacterium]